MTNPPNKPSPFTEWLASLVAHLIVGAIVICIAVGAILAGGVLNVFLKALAGGACG